MIISMNEYKYRHTLYQAIPFYKNFDAEMKDLHIQIFDKLSKIKDDLNLN
jgi:hypothetical protein